MYSPAILHIGSHQPPTLYRATQGGYLFPIIAFNIISSYNKRRHLSRGFVQTNSLAKKGGHGDKGDLYDSQIAEIVYHGEEKEDRETKYSRVWAQQHATHKKRLYLLEYRRNME